VDIWVCRLRSCNVGRRRVKICVGSEGSGRVTVSSKERFQSKCAPEGGIRFGRGGLQDVWRMIGLWNDESGRRGLGETWRGERICDRVCGTGVKIRFGVGQRRMGSRVHGAGSSILVDISAGNVGGGR